MTKIELFRTLANADEMAMETIFGENTEEALKTINHYIEVDEQAKLKAKEKRANAEPTETYINNKKILEEQLLPIMTNEPITAAQIAEKLNISTPKANAIAKIGVSIEKIIVENVKSNGRTVKGYKIF